MGAKPLQARAQIPILAIALVLIIAIAWVRVALQLHQPLLASQKSSLLLQVGALDGDTLERGQWWRVFSSQFLHVHFAHMLFNLGAILVLATAIERRAGSLALALVYLLGGSVGQYFSVFVHPELVSSGASQALMALCGFALVGVKRFSIGRHALILSAIVALIQFVLDVIVSGAIKPGHSAGFVAGILIAFAWPRRWADPITS